MKILILILALSSLVFSYSINVLRTTQKSLNGNSISSNTKVYNCTKIQGGGSCVSGPCCGNSCCFSEYYCSNENLDGICVALTAISEILAYRYSECGENDDGYYITESNACGRKWTIPLLVIIAWTFIFMIGNHAIPAPSKETILVVNLSPENFSFVNLILSIFLTPILWSFLIFRIKSKISKIALVRAVGGGFYIWGIGYSLFYDYTFMVCILCFIIGSGLFMWANQLGRQNRNENRIISADVQMNATIEATEPLPVYNPSFNSQEPPEYTPGDVPSMPSPTIQNPPPYYIAQLENPPTIEYPNIFIIAANLNMPELLCITIHDEQITTQQLSLMTFNQLQPFGITRETYLILKRYFLAQSLGIQT